MENKKIIFALITILCVEDMWHYFGYSSYFLAYSLRTCYQEEFTDTCADNSDGFDLLILQRPKRYDVEDAIFYVVDDNEGTDTKSST